MIIFKIDSSQVTKNVIKNNDDTYMKRIKNYLKGVNLKEKKRRLKANQDKSDKSF